MKDLKTRDNRCLLMTGGHPGRGSSPEPNHASTLILDAPSLQNFEQPIVWFINHQSMLFCHSSPNRLRQK